MKKDLESKLNEINDIVRKKYCEMEDIGGVSGISGITMFLYHYSRYFQIEDDLVYDSLRLCVDKIDQGYEFPTYCNGIAGAGWVFDYLFKEKFIDNPDNLFSELDTYLYSHMIESMESGNFDFLHGGLGYGFYFLKRFQNTKSIVLKDRYKMYLLELIEMIAFLSETENGRTKWKSAVNFENFEKVYNLSLSHGISSIVNFLSRLYLLEDFKDAVNELLRGGVQYIISHMNTDEKSFSMFPNIIFENRDVIWNSRVSWCYGDLGIAVSLWHASEALGDKLLKENVMKILINTQERISYERSRVEDAGICHGSFGNALIFNFFYRKMRVESFKEVSEFWIEDGLQKAFHENGYAGYMQWQGDKNIWKNELSVLEGVAGIGLSIISVLSEQNLYWDECLMIN